MAHPELQLVADTVSDPKELARARAQRERADRNAAWMRENAETIYSSHRGKCICVAGESLFVADTPEAAYHLGRTAFPDDDGLFVRYIPLKNVALGQGDRYQIVRTSK